MVKRTIAQQLRISSFGFSGAGFLASYHLGVVKVLQEQGLLLAAAGGVGPNSKDKQQLLPLTGVSAGALVAASVAVGMDAEEGMDTVLEIARQTRQAGRLATLQPGFSLVDVMEVEVSKRLHKAVNDDTEEFLRRIENGRLLRIGLTDRRVWPPVGKNPRAICYVDRYRDIDDVVAACVLSSYVPGVTGPARGSLDGRHKATLRAAGRLQEMVGMGCVKNLSGEPLSPMELSSDLRELYWDGGLVNAFPIFDEDTVIVTPIAADFSNVSINPSVEYRDEDKEGLQSMRSLKSVVANPNIHITTANLHTFRSLLLDPAESNLQAFYAKGYDNAVAFLHRHSLLQVYKSTSQQASTP